jgi:hypothetical protein
MGLVEDRCRKSSTIRPFTNEGVEVTLIVTYRKIVNGMSEDNTVGVGTIRTKERTVFF